ncbi:PREDICTED: DNA-binding protein SMUBP-2-like [Nanorana parkeri]|uniref:DNA-binding protein SMUBP-2-like n=1 Tax=Nanorana parkeri TaxID=125878 RepID=UPI000854424D|nr:PREDICTED: DNA-binding protein SMUBP-2-like [Nanorana parkeri]
MVLLREHVILRTFVHIFARISARTSTRPDTTMHATPSYSMFAHNPEGRAACVYPYWPLGEVGFLSEERRINVAITRARRHVSVICDSHTVSNNKFLKDLVTYFNEHGEVRTAFEYLDDIVPEKYSQENESSKPETSVKKDIRAKPKKSGNSNLSSHRPNTTTESQAKEKNRTKQADSVKNFQHSKNLDDQTESSAKDKLQEEIEDFIANNDKTQLTFPSTLTSHERLLVHQIAEKCGLQHVSTGDGGNRCITLSKHKVISAEAVSQTLDDFVAQKPLQSQTSEKEAEEKEICRKAPPSNLDLKRLHMERMHREKDKLEEKAKIKKEATVPKVAEKKAMDTKRKSGNKSEAERSDMDSFDSLLAEAVKADNTCGFGKCKASVVTVGNFCILCNKRFCLSHHIPEVHGCGERVKARARARISREGVIYAGSGHKDHSLDPTKKAHLQRKIDKKINELSNQRKVKKEK